MAVSSRTFMHIVPILVYARWCELEDFIDMRQPCVGLVASVTARLICSTIFGLRADQCFVFGVDCKMIGRSFFRRLVHTPEVSIGIPPRLRTTTHAE